MNTSADIDRLLEAFADPRVTDLVLNGYSQSMVLTPAGWQATTAPVASDSQLDELAIVLVSLANRHLDLANPMADVTLGVAELPRLGQLGLQSIRVHAVLGRTVAAQSLISVRAHRARAEQPLSEVLSGFQGGRSFLSRLEEVAVSGGSFLISGPPGSGKTTLLRALLGRLPQLRTVVIEDTAELLPLSGHFIGLQARQANTDGRGEIGIGQMLREALRMNPDRLVVGEVRGAEATVLVDAINLAGIGGAGTMHARLAGQAAGRLRALTGNERALQVFDWHIHLERSSNSRAITAVERVAR